MSELPPKDKRTKAFKKWAEKHAKTSEGLGDTVEKITTATGIKKAVKWLAGDDCGCDERKEKLNEMFKYQKPECFKEDEFNYLQEKFENRKNTVNSGEQQRMLQIYNRVFNENVSPTNCSPCFKKGVYDKLEKLYRQYLG